jgi:hypothetical protein
MATLEAKKAFRAFLSSHVIGKASAAGGGRSLAVSDVSSAAAGWRAAFAQGASAGGAMQNGSTMMASDTLRWDQNATMNGALQTLFEPTAHNPSA